MKATDLMAGDYVIPRRLGRPVKVAAVHHKKIAYHATRDKLTWVREGLLDAAPVTAEILKKNNILFEIGPSGLFKVTIKGINCEMRFNIIRHIHELQHALRICGIKKEIEL